MPKTNIKPLAEIDIQIPGKVTPIEFKEIPEKKLKFDNLKLNKLRR